MWIATHVHDPNTRCDITQILRILAKLSYANLRILKGSLTTRTLISGMTQQRGWGGGSFFCMDANFKGKVKHTFFLKNDQKCRCPSIKPGLKGNRSNSDKLTHLQVVINCLYSVAQFCTGKDMLAHMSGMPSIDDVMSYNSLTTQGIEAL